MSIFTKEEYEQLELVYSRKTFVQLNQCMVCQTSSSPEGLNSITYMLPFSILNTVSNMLIFCSGCEKKAKYVYIRECIEVKKLPTATPLFNPDYEFKVIRTNGDESVGQLEPHLNLGWSSSQNEITAWVKLDGSQVTKPLTLSLFFEANPQLRDLPEFLNGLVLTFEYEDMFKTEFLDFYNKIQTAIKQLNDKFFSDRM